MPEIMTREEAYAVTDELAQFALNHTKRFILDTAGHISATVLSIASNAGTGTAGSGEGAQTYATQSARSQVQNARAHAASCVEC